jgi:hypothetical protein
VVLFATEELMLQWKMQIIIACQTDDFVFTTPSRKTIKEISE